jgi:hypothetical protein
VLQRVIPFRADRSRPTGVWPSWPPPPCPLHGATQPPPTALPTPVEHTSAHQGGPAFVPAIQQPCTSSPALPHVEERGRAAYGGGNLQSPARLFIFGKVLHSCCAAYALSKKGPRDVLPVTAGGRTATQQLPSCCRVIFFCLGVGGLKQGRLRPDWAARPALMRRAAHAVESKAAVRIEVAVSPRPCLGCAVELAVFLPAAANCRSARPTSPPHS